MCDGNKNQHDFITEKIEKRLGMFIMLVIKDSNN